jgi:hypothetical protein
VVRDCSGLRLKHGIYNDTGEMFDGLVDGCMFSDLEYTGATFVAIGNDSTRNPSPGRRRIAVINSRFGYTPAKDYEWIGMTLLDFNDCGGVFEDILLENCSFHGNHPRPFHLVSAKARNLRGVRVMKNVVPTGTIFNRAAPTPSHQQGLQFVSNRQENGNTWP